MKRFVVALVLILISVQASAQTLGTKLPGSNAFKETWKVTVPAGDSLSSYFIVPPYVDVVFAHFDLFEAGGVLFEVAVDTSKVSGGRVLSDFHILYNFSAIKDTIVSSTGNMTVNITDRVKGAIAVRFHIGTAAVTQANIVGIYVFIRKKPPS